MMRRLLPVFLVALSLTLIIHPAVFAQSNSRYFAETGHNVGGKFLEYWNKHGGLSQQGYPISEEMTEVSDVDAKPYTVQYFERAVMELHPENQAPYDVLLTPVGSLRYKSLYTSRAPTEEASPSAAGYFKETKHSVTGRFAEYWQTHGGLQQQGYPITEPFLEASDLDGKTYTVQYFERAVFELHPENAKPNDVLLSQLGTFRYKAKYAGGPQAGNPPASNPPVSNPPVQPPPANAGPTLTGAGRQATPSFHLEAGLAVFHSQHTVGTSNFIAYLLDKNGEEVALVANGIGEYESRFAVNISKADDYILNVTADGNWTISVEYPKANYSPPPATQSFSGSGDSVTQLFSLKKGLARFNSEYVGADANFIVYLLDSNGEEIALVANEIGNSQSSKATSIPANGVYLLSVRGEGTWTITVNQ